MSLGLGFNWRDQYGRSAKSSLFVDPSLSSNADMETLRGLLEACSDGSIDAEWQEYSYNRDEADVVAALDTAMSVKDVCILVFRSSVGKLVKVTLVKPALAILTNDEVLDKTHALVVAIKAAALLYLKDNAGNPIVDLVEGYRSRNKKKL